MESLVGIVEFGGCSNLESSPTSVDRGDVNGTRQYVGIVGGGDCTVEEGNENIQGGQSLRRSPRLPELRENTVEEYYDNSDGLEDGNAEELVVGLVFPTMKDVEKFYKRYDCNKGFGVITLRGSYNKNGERRATTCSCECNGDPDRKYIQQSRRKAKDINWYHVEEIDVTKVKQRGSKKCFCTTMIYATRIEVNKWVIRNVVLEHKNHESKSSDANLVKQYRMKSFNQHVQRKLFNDYNAGVSVPKIRNSMALARGGFENVSFTENDMRHVLHAARKLKIVGGDANALVAYFEKMQRDSVNFFHCHRLDEEGTTKDIFWVDVCSRAAYEEFSDVVCFDTTYLTNQYALPFANFVGANHHGQTILLGCAMILSKDCDTFGWVFQQWLLCIKGRQPGGILTDEAAAFRRPLEDVMPQTRHRWCIWHILNKLPYKLGSHDQ